MRTATLLLVAAIVALVCPARGAGFPYPADRQWIYCAEHAEDCFLYCMGHMQCPLPDTMYVFIRANDPLGVDRAHFRLDTNYPCCDSIQAVIPCPGVTIDEGNLSEGMTISFPLQQSGHFKALALVIWHECLDAPPMGNYGFLVQDAWLERADDEVVALSDYYTMPVYQDCYMTSILWYHPDTMDVFIGSQTDVKIQWEVNGAYYFGFYVTITDGQGWVSNYAPNGIWYTGCLTCLWHIETTHIYTELPGDVSAGTLSTLTIINTKSGSPLESLVLRAVPPIATEEQSWSTVKDLFK